MQSQHLLRNLLEIFPGLDPEFVRVSIRFHGYKDSPTTVVSHLHLTEIQKKICEIGEEYPRVQNKFCCRGCTNKGCTPSFNAATLNSLLDDLMKAFPEIDQQFIFSVMQDKIRSSHADLFNRVSLVLAANPAVKRRKFCSPPNRKFLFRCPCYKEATRATLLNRYPDLWKSQVDAVLSETDHYYVNANLSLSALSPTGPWAFQQIAKFFSRKKMALPKGMCDDFLEDLREEERAQRADEEEAGLKLAKEFERELQEEDEQLVECECCFDDVPPSELAVCSEGEHFICHECLRRYIKENISPLMVEKAGEEDDCPTFLPCLSMGGCEAQIRPEMLEAALPKETKKWFDQILLLNEVKRAHGKSTMCPACSTLEVSLPQQESTKPPKELLNYFLTPEFLRPASAIGFCLFAGYCLYAPQIYLFLVVCFCLGGPMKEFWKQGRSKVEGENVVGPPQHFCSKCHISFCLDCESYHPMEKCQQLGKPGGGTAEGLRLYIEEQMSQVTVRICPDCGTQFQKDGGCNKMTCNCGYSMCYICRKNLHEEGYAHFCTHFRPEGGTCPQSGCKKCELFRSPNDEALCIQVARRAKRAYMVMYPKIGQEGKNLTTVGGVKFE